MRSITPEERRISSLSNNSSGSSRKGGSQTQTTISATTSITGSGGKLKLITSDKDNSLSHPSSGGSRNSTLERIVNACNVSIPTTATTNIERKRYDIVYDVSGSRRLTPSSRSSSSSSYSENDLTTNLAADVTGNYRRSQIRQNLRNDGDYKIRRSR